MHQRRGGKKRQALTRALTLGHTPERAARTANADAEPAPAVDFLRSGALSAAAPAPDVVEVLAENWQAVEVFGHCQMTWIGSGMGGMLAIGIAAKEAQAAIQMLGAEPQAEVFGQVIEMGREAARMLNERAGRHEPE